MECERFKRLFKNWYLQVQDEALAPARMVELMENHIADCPVCMMDPDVRQDMKKIITLVLPQDKLKIVPRTNRKKPVEEPGSAAVAADEIEDDDSLGEDTATADSADEDDEDDVIVDPDLEDPLV